MTEYSHSSLAPTVSSGVLTSSSYNSYLGLGFSQDFFSPGRHGWRTSSGGGLPWCFVSWFLTLLIRTLLCSEVCSLGDQEVIGWLPWCPLFRWFYSIKPEAWGVLWSSSVPDPPVLAKARHLDSEKLASAKNEFAKMEPAGIIQRSSSLWSSPLHMVKIKKSDGSWRSCGNYRRFNTVTVPDRYPLSSVSDFFTKIFGSNGVLQAGPTERLLFWR